VPSVPHEVLVEIVRDHPEHVIHLLRAAFDLRLDGSIERVGQSENLTRVQPPEHRADAVLLLRGRRGRARHALVVEVQLTRDAKKKLSWPVYVTVLRARFGCPVSLVVLALDDAIARWCARPIAIDPHGSLLCPLVIGPAQVPIVRRASARRHPELALLSLLRAQARARRARARPHRARAVRAPRRGPCQAVR
jgi:hypothetical protein